MTFNKKLLRSIEQYFEEFSDDKFPVIYRKGNLQIYETFIGINNDGCDISIIDDPRPVALLADKIYYNEPLSNKEFLNSIKFSKELELLKLNLIEYATNEFPIK